MVTAPMWTSRPSNTQVWGAEKQSGGAAVAEALFAEQFAHQLDGRRPVATTLDEDLEDLALVVDSTPQIHPLAGDPHHHLVEMPAVARPRATLAQPSCDRGTEFQHPAPDRLVGDVKPSFSQQFLDIAVAQGEAVIEPDRVLDDLGPEAMTAVAERSHLDILPDTPPSRDPVSVTMPLRTLEHSRPIGLGAACLRAATADSIGFLNSAWSASSAKRARQREVTGWQYLRPQVCPTRDTACSCVARSSRAPSGRSSKPTIFCSTCRSLRSSSRSCTSRHRTRWLEPCRPSASTRSDLSPA